MRRVSRRKFEDGDDINPDAGGRRTRAKTPTFSTPSSFELPPEDEGSRMPLVKTTNKATPARAKRGRHDNADEVQEQLTRQHSRLDYTDDDDDGHHYDPDASQSQLSHSEMTEASQRRQQRSTRQQRHGKEGRRNEDQFDDGDYTYKDDDSERDANGSFMPVVRKLAAKSERATAMVAEVVSDVVSDVVDAAAIKPELTPRKQLRELVPHILHFPIIITASLCIMSMGYSVLREVSGAASEWAAVTRPLESYGDVGLLMFWRILELGIGWYGNFDSYDLAALAVLTHGPTLYLLWAFYGISMNNVLSVLLIEMACSAIPFWLLRPVSVPHSITRNALHSALMPPANQAVINDRTIQVVTTLVAALVYGITLMLAYSTYLPRTLVLHFWNIPSIAPAKTLTIAPLLPIVPIFGHAARCFIFTPAAATGRTSDDVRVDHFDPVRASLLETWKWNVWGWRSGTKVGIQRTLAAALLSGVSTMMQLGVGVRGVDLEGAFGYSIVWVVAALATGTILGMIWSE